MSSSKPSDATQTASTSVYSAKLNIKDGKLNVMLKKDNETEFRLPSFLPSKEMTGVAEGTPVKGATMVDMPNSAKTKKEDKIKTN
jgi:hypothetical protein